MKITKLGHACLVLEQDDHTLVIDPGNFTAPVEGLSGVHAIVITHLHDDHCWPNQIRRILATNPGAVLIGPQGVADKLSDFHVRVVNDGDAVQVPGFALTFHGGQHAIIHKSIPVIDNIGVFVNDGLYYPGDSFALPGRDIPVLAVPSSAPWLKVAEVIDFVVAAKAEVAFPTHNALWSQQGQALANARIGEFVEASGGKFVFLDAGESFEASTRTPRHR